MERDSDEFPNGRPHDPLAIDGGPKTVEGDDADVFSWPIVTESDEEAALAVLREGKASDVDVTKRFEEEFAEWQGREHALGFSSGTASLWGAMYGVGVGAGDEVIAPSVTYWASILPSMGLGAVPVFADIDPETLCLDPSSFEERISEHTEAVVVVHSYGHPADMDAILDVAREHDVSVIEDVSHAHGGQYDGRTLGTFGDVAAMSLMSGKALAIGEGGMLVTDDRSIYERALAFGHYRRRDELQREDLIPLADVALGGQKHRMHQVSSAVGRVQLEHYDDRMAEIHRAMHYFWDQLDDVPGIRAHRPSDDGSLMGGWYSPKGLYRPDELGGLPVERFAEAVTAEGSTCSPGCNFPLHTHPVFQEADVYDHGEPTRLVNASRDVREDEGDLPVAEGIQDRCFTVPWFKRFEPAVIDRHVEAYRKVAETYSDVG
jgi:dTDP-4-amino-4,6-dideoxygalactose transaminase